MNENEIAWRGQGETSDIIFLFILKALMERGYTQFMNRFKSFDYMSYLMRAHMYNAMKWNFFWGPGSRDHWRISMIVMQRVQAQRQQKSEECEMKNSS